MKNLIRRLFHHEPASSAATPASSPNVELTINGKNEREEIYEDVRRIFFPGLLGCGNAAAIPLSPVEARLLRALQQKIQGGITTLVDQIPHMPAILPVLLQSLRDADVSNTKLAEQISRDPVMTTALLKQANSTFYRSRHIVSSVEQALAVVGQNNLRIIIARAAFRPLFQNLLGYYTRASAPRIWSLSALHGNCARRAAELLRTDGFEAYLATLLFGTGVLIALRLLDRELPTPSSELYSYAFFDGFAKCCVLLAQAVGHHWDFPANVIQSLEEASQQSGITSTSRAENKLSHAVSLSMTVAIFRLLVTERILNEDLLNQFLPSQDLQAGLACYRFLAEQSESDEDDVLTQ